MTNVYKVIHGVEIEDFNIELCDEVIRNFGLDKMRDIYFHNSREVVSDKKGLTQPANVEVCMVEQWTPFEYIVPSDVVAIKSLEITVST